MLTEAMKVSPGSLKVLTSLDTKGFVSWGIRFVTSCEPLEGLKLKRNVALGFTLVEMLVALVVTSLLISILMGMLYYMSRVQDSLQGEVVIREAQLRTKAWFSELVANCLPVEKVPESPSRVQSRKLLVKRPLR